MPAAGNGESGWPHPRRRDASNGRPRDEINLDVYYRGLAAEQLQALGDRLLRLAGEAEAADARDAAWHLAELSTELLEMGLQVSTQHTGRRQGEPL